MACLAERAVNVSFRMAQMSTLSSLQSEGNAACSFDGGSDRTTDSGTDRPKTTLEG
jgi:hypothetical protein